jgi:hypothetical protein
MPKWIAPQVRRLAFATSFRHEFHAVRSMSVATCARRTGSRGIRWRASASVPNGDPMRLAPSDFAFLWEECRRCFYLKAHKKLFRPRAPFPSIFNTIDLEMKRHMRGLRTTDVIPSMKPGVFLCEDNDAWVECSPITPPGRSGSVFIRGMVRNVYLESWDGVC